MQLQIGVKVLIKNSSDKYLFIQRTTLLQNEMDLSWDIPGGRIESYEPLHTALKREFMEELNVPLTAAPLLLNAQDIFVEKKQLHVVRLTYLADQNISDSSVHLSSEHKEYCWATIENAMQLNLDPYLKETLRQL